VSGRRLVSRPMRQSSALTPARTELSGPGSGFGLKEVLGGISKRRRPV
jgi:hypothetical protein